jgi:peptide/nickel transport system permease protein
VLILPRRAAALAAPVLTSYGPREPVSYEFFAPPSRHWLGLDGQGYDLFSRIVYGARTTLRIALLATLLSLVIGGTAGGACGLHRAAGRTCC